MVSVEGLGPPDIAAPGVALRCQVGPARPWACDASCNAPLQSLQAPDRRGVYVEGPRYIRLRLASREPCNRFLPLMSRQLAGPAELDAATHPIDCGFTSRTLFQ